jgi:hypothetical protein
MYCSGKSGGLVRLGFVRFGLVSVAHAQKVIANGVVIIPPRDFKHTS